MAKRITGVVLDEKAIIRTNDKVRSIEGKEIGRVTSICLSPQLKRTIALCMIKYDYLAPDTPAIVLSDGAEHAGRVAELPFVRGSWPADSATDT